MILIFIIIVLFSLIMYSSQFNKTTVLGPEKIKTLIRQSARWAIASEQDNNPYIAMLHANYGAGYIFAIRSIASDTEIKSATGVNARQLEKEIVRIQDKSFRNLAKVCPEGQPKSQFLRAISGEGI